MLVSSPLGFRQFVDDDGLPEAFEGHLFLKFVEVDTTKVMEIQRMSFLYANIRKLVIHPAQLGISMHKPCQSVHTHI